MIRLLSIFNFNTLRGSFVPGRAVVLAILLVAAAEGAARWIVPNLQLAESLASFDLWVAHLQDQLESSGADIWFIGNSTLHHGIDANEFAQATGQSVCKLTFGSGTLSGETAMLEYYLRRIRPTPRQVYFFLSKDDLNSAGLRAQVSETYRDYDTWRGFNMGRLFRMDDVRKMLGRHVSEWVTTRRGTSAGEPEKPSVFDGHLTPAGKAYLKKLMRNYTFDDSGFVQLDHLSRKYQFQVKLIWMPVTDAYLRFHDQQGVTPTAHTIARRVEELCARYRFGFYDFSGMASDRYEWFGDAYHLNESGRAQFTQAAASMQETLRE